MSHFSTGQTKEQARTAFQQAEVPFRGTYEKLLMQPGGTFDLGQPP
jgi:hypothetical protein